MGACPRRFCHPGVDQSGPPPSGRQPGLATEDRPLHRAFAARQRDRRRSPVVRRAAVGAPELLESGDIAQHIFQQTGRAVAEPRAIDHDRSISGRARGQRQPLAEHDDIAAAGRDAARHAKP